MLSVLLCVFHCLQGDTLQKKLLEEPLLFYMHLCNHWHKLKKKDMIVLNSITGSPGIVLPSPQASAFGLSHSSLQQPG